MSHCCCCQTSEQRYTFNMPRYFKLFVALATAFALYQVSSPFSTSANKATEL